MTRLASVEIQHFRIIERVRLDLTDPTLVIGANNAGKSSLLRALRVLFGTEKWSSDDEPAGKNGADTSIRGEFETGDVVTFNRKVGDAKPTWQVNDEDPTKSPGGPAKDAQVMFVPATLDVDAHSKTTGPSPLRELVAAALGSALDDGLRKLLDEVAQSLRESDAIGKVREALNRGLRDWDVDLNVVVQAPDADDIIKRWFGLQASDGDVVVDVEDLGSGTQRAVIHSLIDAVARQGEGSDDASQDSLVLVDGPERSRVRLLLFEEPEMALHPGQIDVLRERLAGLADAGLQTIVTTHSPRFVGGDIPDLRSLVRLGRTESGTSRGHQLTVALIEEMAEQVIESFEDVTSGKAASEAFEELRLTMLVDQAVAGAFFGQSVLLVEGATEVALVKYLRGVGQLSLPSTVEVVNGLGKYNFVRLIPLLRGLGIRYSLVFDRDGDRESRRTNHKVLNAVLDGYLSEDKAASVEFEQDLEAALGYDAPKSTDRKPAILLEKLRASEIDAEVLRDLCARIEDCVAPTTSGEGQVD